MAEAEFSRCLKDHSDVMRYAQEILQLLTSEKQVHEARKMAEAVAKVSEKTNKGKESIQRSVHGLQERKQQIREGVTSEYSRALGDSEGSEPNASRVKQAVRDVRQQLKEKEKERQKLENERRRLTFHKKHRSLQKKIAQIRFDLSSTDAHVKGYLKKPNGELQTFEFDFSEDSPCYVADFLWDSI